MRSDELCLAMGSPRHLVARPPERQAASTGERALTDLVLSLASSGAGAGDVDAAVRTLATKLPAVVPFAQGQLLTVVGLRGRLSALVPEGSGGASVTLSRAFLRALATRRPESLAPPPFVTFKGRVGSALVQPLCVRGVAVGALFLARRPGSLFTREERTCLSEVGPAVAAHLAITLRIEETENRLYQLALVNAASRKMSATLEHQALVLDVVTAIQSTFGFTHVMLFRVDRDRERATQLAYAGRHGPRRAKGSQPLSKGLVGYAATHGETVVSDDVRRDTRYFRGGLRGTRSELAIPLVAEDKAFGVLDLGSEETHAFDRGTIVVLETLASLVANLLRNADHYGRASFQAEKLRVLLETSRLIARSVDSDDILQEIAMQAKKLLRAHGCSIYKLLSGGVLHPVLSQEPRYNRQILRTDLQVGKGIVGSVVTAGRPELVNDPRSDPRARHIPGTPWTGNERMMVAPLHARGRQLGAMTLSRPRESFTQEDLDLFSIFAGLAADTMASAELHREVRGTKDFLERLVEASADAIVTTDLRGRITLYSRGAEALFGYSVSEVMGRPVYAFYVDGKEEGRRLMRLLRKSERATNYEIQFMAKGGQPITCMMSASLLRDAGGHAIGTLGISKDISERVRLEKRLLELTTEDDLTRLYNARHFWESVGYELRRALRQRAPLSLFLFDLDGFKRYNDERGHLAGDAMLQMVARILRACIRSDIDKAFRYGGDEFVVLLPGAQRDVAQRIAERVRERIFGATHGELSVSIGLVEGERGITDPRRFVHAADRAMYRAKRAGGDRVEVA